MFGDIPDYRFAQKDQPKSRAFVHPARRDGKIPVTFVYPISGRQIRKLIDPADIEAKTSGYDVIKVR